MALALGCTDVAVVCWIPFIPRIRLPYLDFRNEGLGPRW